jgi:cytoskeletal protein RodZ
VTNGKSSHRDHGRSSEALSAKTGSTTGPRAGTAQDAAPTIGRVLAEARLAAGLTVDEVSADTRVRVPIVHAIEEDDFSRCGGDFYARGHLRSLARAVGADGDALVARYDEIHGTAPVVLAPIATLDARRIRADRGRPSWTGAMVVAIAAVVLLIAFNLVSSKPGKEQAGAASSPLPSVTASASTSPSPTPVQPPAPTPSIAPIAAAPADKVTVKLVAEGGTSWVSAQDGDGNSLFQNNLDDGSNQTFTDPKQIELVIGNAAAVHLYVNGKDLGPAGKDGQVVHLTYTPGDPQAG